MRFKSQERRLEMKLLAAGALFDFLCVVLFTYAIGPGGNLLLVSAAVFVGLQILTLLLAIKNALWAWAVFHWHSRDKHQEKIANHFLEQGFPDPEEYEESAPSYLNRLRNDTNLPVEVRTAAAAEHGAYDAICGRGVLASVYTATIYEGAIAKLPEMRRVR